MKVKVTATSAWGFCNSEILEVDTIDSAINILKTNTELLKHIVGSNSIYKNEASIPYLFVVNTTKQENFDVLIEVYDDYRE